MLHGENKNGGADSVKPDRRPVDDANRHIVDAAPVVVREQGRRKHNIPKPPPDVPKAKESHDQNGAN